MFWGGLGSGEKGRMLASVTLDCELPEVTNFGFVVFHFVSPAIRK